MKTLIKISLVVTLTLGVVIGYFVYLHIYSVQTLVLRNQGDWPITVSAYNQAWTLAARTRMTVRFTTAGDGHFTITDPANVGQLGEAGYMTNGLPSCHDLTLRADLSIAYQADTEALCHLLRW